MEKHYTEEFLILLVSSFAFCTLGYLLILQAKKSHGGLLRKILYVPSRKSTTGAVLLGGLPLACTVILSYLALLYFEDFREFFLFSERYLIKYWLMGSFFFVVYGHLDDKYELKPIVKLGFQFLGVFIFSFLSSKVVWPDNSTIAFIVLSVWGLGVVNGANLLDGLDTLAIKLFSAIYLTFMALGFFYGNSAVILGSLVSAVPLLAFLYFNKEPAKIHLGEIGGSFLGYSFLLLSAILFNSLKFKYFHFRAMSISLIPLTLPMVELVTSFLRRVYNKKSPFSGDKLHVHYILKNEYNFSATLIADIMSLFYLLTGLSAITITYIIHPLWALIFHIFVVTGVYYSIGKKKWKGLDTIELNPKNILNFMQKRKIHLIDSAAIDNFNITIEPNQRKKSHDEDAA